MHLSSSVDFTSSTSGGVIIGIASTALLMMTGKLTGLSGIVEEALIPPRGYDVSWIEHKSQALTYVTGLVGSGYLYSLYKPEFIASTPADISALTILSGVLVGFGTRMGSGCTSGHGVCGLPRLSKRSIVAVSTFMAEGAIGALVGRKLVESNYFPNISTQVLEDLTQFGLNLPLIITSTGIFSLFSFIRHLKHGHYHDHKKNDDHNDSITINYKEHFSNLLTSLTFGLGLAVSGMCDSNKVKDFLDFSGPRGWDPSLAAVMGGSVVFNLVSFYLLRASKFIPIFAPNKGSMDKIIKVGNDSTNVLINRKLIIGSAIFGLGWGIGGVCPGPAFVLLGSGAAVVKVFIPSLLIGMAAQELVFYHLF
jgi:uncharacterized membrane protein YedE/YeeE